MKGKTFFLIVMVTIFCSLVLLGKSKPPAIPMSELTDPNSPSYVPYPYPKTELEILEDLKHAIRINFAKNRKTNRAYISKEVEKQSMAHEDLVRGLIAEEPTLFIKDINKVIDLQANSSFEFYYLVSLANGEQKIQCVAKVDDCGLWGGFMFIDNGSKFQPYPDQEKALAIFQSKIKDRLVQKAEYVYAVSNISDFFFPLWRIETNGAVFFIDCKGDVYELQNESVPLREGNSYDLSPEQKNELLLFDDLHDRVCFLKKID